MILVPAMLLSAELTARRSLLPLLTLFFALLPGAFVDSFPLPPHLGAFRASTVSTSCFRRRRTLSSVFLSQAKEGVGDSVNENNKDGRSSSSKHRSNAGRPLRAVEKELGGYDPYEKLGGRQVDVGDPQIKVQDKERSVTSILKELAAIQQQGPQKYCILGTRHCSFLHQQIIELLYVRQLHETVLQCECCFANQSDTSFRLLLQCICTRSIRKSRLYVRSRWHTRGHCSRCTPSGKAGSIDSDTPAINE